MKTELKYPLIIFLLWIAAPLCLYLIIYFVNNLILNPNFFISLIIPAIALSLLSFLLTKIKNREIRTASYYSLVGALIWASPAIYFLTGSELYYSLSSTNKVLLILLPSALLSIIFFIFGKIKAKPASDLSDLYVKKYMYSKNE